MWSNGFSHTLDLRPHPAGLPFYIDAALCVLGLLGLGGLLASRQQPGLALLTAIVASSLLFGRWRRDRRDRVTRVLARADGEWRIQLGDGESRQVRLTGAWLLPGLTGLCWRAPGSRPYLCWLVRSEVGQTNWRRLRVRLRLPLGRRIA